MVIEWSDEDNAYIVSLPEWGDLVHTHGETYAEAVAMGEELLQKLPHIVAVRRHQQPLGFFQELGELKYVCGIRFDRKSRQSLLDAQVIEKAREHPRVGFRSHDQKRFSMRVIGRRKK